ncbi:MAG TPA: helix-turn-helix domain-containing protein [Solirubrobacteraceae bacterium]|nr:helix-turn-helix domain-containing protein [Solirubrobacteraceae bacterium]
MATQPWHELPPAVAAVVRPLLPGLVDEVIAAVGTVPAYQRPLEGDFGVGVRAGVEEALNHLVLEIEAGGPVPRSDVYRRLGRGEMRAGRSLDALLSAYRAGARVMWRRAAEAGEASGLEPATLYLLAESIFAYIDVLSAESAEGYAREQTQIAGETELARRRLVRLLVRDPPAEPELVQAAAREAAWELPRTLAAVAISAGTGDAGEAADQPQGGSRRPPAVRLPVGAITETVGEVLCAIVPDPEAPGRRAQLVRAVRQARVHAGLGTTVAWSDAALSFGRARAALALAPVGGEPLIGARDHAGELLLHADPVLAAEFATAQLAPLAELSAGSRERLTATLAAWLEEQGRLGPAALRLGIHPQTARYRLARLRELFGDGLDDPDKRFWLALALRVSREAH